MKKIANFDNIQEAQGGGYRRIPDGGYVAVITEVEDRESGAYLYVKYDIAKGEYKDFYKKDYERNTNAKKWWGGTFIKSYKEKALPMFKAFITSVEKSNKNFKWDFDEQKLKGKLVGVVIGTEEYISSAGKVKERPYVFSTHSVEAIESGNFTVPKMRKLTPSDTKAESKNEPFFNPFANAETNEERAEEDFKSPFDEDETSPF